MYDINSISELEKCLGGQDAIAKWLHISQPAVAMWKNRKQIGTGWHMRIYAKVRAKGKTINPKVFGLSEEEAAGLAGKSKSNGRSHRAA